MNLRLVFATCCALVTPLSADSPKKIDPSRYEKEIAAIETKTRAAGNPRGAILFVGSSSIRLWDLEASWPGLTVLNHGFGGSTLPDTLHYFDRLVAPFAPKAVVVYAGDNDIGSFNRTAADMASDFKTLVEKMEAGLPGVPLVFIAIKPSVKRWHLWPEMNAANEAIAAICAGREGLHFADIAAPMLRDRQGAPAPEWFVKDGLHLSPTGYERWTRVIRATLVEAGALKE